MKKFSCYRAHKEMLPPMPTPMNLNYSSPPFLIKRRAENERKSTI